MRAGSCWRLYSEDYFLSHRVDEHPLPEIQRVPLEEVTLQVSNPAPGYLGIPVSYRCLCC